ncbi:MAG: sugar ABC transporter ATP-binding protein [Betaproteobacteria bacterium AqS2]|uniref:Sugar ABC transporter ATP-binding protein n=1 Tax=Candidatus Amphirhobacter heronislandensis TaxID=1732024 RepID=A0A930UIL3_9GAMM|nr:sugar ABC transporter ATP-binding protein [Betaproteobacteria bacterium AqS2]
MNADAGQEAGAAATPLIEFRDVGKNYGNIIAIEGVSFKLRAGGCTCCLLGDNGAGKSTLIKILAGVHKPTHGEVFFEGRPIDFDSPREALDLGIATVYQDLALVPLMSITRNFFMGRETEFVRRRWGLPYFDTKAAGEMCRTSMAEVGIDIRDPNQAVGTMSGGERQCLAIARAIHFGARVLILDEPTAALGVKQSANVLRLVAQARARGIGVILITHNVHHAYPVGDAFTLLNRGHSLGYFEKAEISREKVLELMAGGSEIADLDHEISEFSRRDDLGGTAAAAT